MDNILLTGFEPFSIYVKNSSYESIKELNGKVIEDFKITSKKLPVVFKSAGKVLKKYLEIYRPKIAISFGMGTQYIQFECIALNINYSLTADNSGKKYFKESEIIPQSSIAYKSTLPYDRIATALRKNNIPLVKSFYAGTYLCNNIFYHLMHLSKKYRIALAGFIHVPPTPECFENAFSSPDKSNHIEENPNYATTALPSYSCVYKPTIQLATLKKGITIIIEECIKYYYSKKRKVRRGKYT